MKKKELLFGKIIFKTYKQIFYSLKIKEFYFKNTFLKICLILTQRTSYSHLPSYYMFIEKISLSFSNREKV